MIPILKRLNNIEAENFMALSVVETGTVEPKIIAREKSQAVRKGRLRPDAVNIVLQPRRFADMTEYDLKKVAMEIATIGRSGLDVNSPETPYQLKNPPGDFSVSLKQIPTKRKPVSRLFYYDFHPPPRERYSATPLSNRAI